MHRRVIVASRDEKIKQTQGLIICEVTLGLHRYSSVGLPVMHALVATHLYICVEIGDSSFIPFLHDGRLSGGSCFALKPLVSHLAYASEVIPIRSQYLLAQVITGLVKVIPVSYTHLTLPTIYSV